MNRDIRVWLYGFCGVVFGLTADLAYQAGDIRPCSLYAFASGYALARALHFWG